MPNLINRKGQIFGNWEVVNQSPSKNKKVYWHCRCINCGAEKDIQGTHLSNNSYANCKCQLSVQKSQNIKLTKICPICGEEFSLIEKGYTRKYCFNCSPSYDKDNSNSHFQTITSLRRAIKKKMVNYKGGKCEICGYNKSLNALQFHHINPEEKDFEISSFVNSFNVLQIDIIQKEVDKCMLVCANCHAELHEQQNLGGQLKRSEHWSEKPEDEGSTPFPPTI